MFFILGGHLDTPVHLYTPVYLYAPWGCKHPHMSPYFSMHLYVLGGICMLWGGCRDPLHIEHLPYILDTSPDMGDASPYVLHAPLIGWLPCASVCLEDICMLYGKYSPYVGGWGIPPYVGGLGASTHLPGFGAWQYIHWVSIMLYLVPFLYFIMSYISTMAMTTTPLVMVASSGLSSISSVAMAPSMMGLPATSGQHEVVLPPPLMLKSPGGVIGLVSMPQQQPSSLMPFLAYANLCYGFSTGRFLFHH